MEATGHDNANMQTSSAPHAAAETEAVSLQINLLALNLAIELARGGGAERGAGLPATGRAMTCASSSTTMPTRWAAAKGCGGRSRSCERVLRQAGEVARRPTVSDQACPEAEPSATEGIGGR